MSDTPRTDSEIGRVHLSEGRNMVAADFARKLELELRKCRSQQFTAAQRRALREAIYFRLAGEMEEEGNRKLLERALEKL